jgi:hypothetical protein
MLLCLECINLNFEHYGESKANATYILVRRIEKLKSKFGCQNKNLHLSQKYILYTKIQTQGNVCLRQSLY